MHRFFSIVLILGALCSGCKEKPVADEKEIKTFLEAYEEAYNSQNAEKLGALWAPDAVWSDPSTGEEVTGRQAIVAFLKEKFERDETQKIQFVHKAVTFSSPDEAIENGVALIEIADQPAKKVAFEMALIKEDGKWLIDEVGEIEITPAPSNFEHLRDLSWLEGSWEDVDLDTEISFETQWDKYKNFLTQHFALKILGEETLEGKQIIAWDSAKNTIRSWVFDSDGGFGEGEWKKVDESWYAAMKYTLADGRIATATNVYTPVGPTLYTFSSVEREVDGEILPNMDPVNVEKIK